MIRFQRAVPFWIRAVLLAGVACIAIGAGLISYRFYTRPVTLTLAVGAFDDKGKQIASIIAGRLAAIDSPIRLKIETSSNSLDAAKALVAGKTDHRGPALKRAIAVVKSGQPALLDVVMDQR